MRSLVLVLGVIQVAVGLNSLNLGLELHTKAMERVKRQSAFQTGGQQSSGMDMSLIDSVLCSVRCWTPRRPGDQSADPAGLHLLLSVLDTGGAGLVPPLLPGLHRHQGLRGTRLRAQPRRQLTRLQRIRGTRLHVRLAQHGPVEPEHTLHPTGEEGEEGWMDEERRRERSGRGGVENEEEEES